MWMKRMTIHLALHCPIIFFFSSPFSWKHFFITFSRAARAFSQLISFDRGHDVKYHKPEENKPKNQNRDQSESGENEGTTKMLIRIQWWQRWWWWRAIVFNLLNLNINKLFHGSILSIWLLPNQVKKNKSKYYSQKWLNFFLDSTTLTYTTHTKERIQKESGCHIKIKIRFN